MADQPLHDIQTDDDIPLFGGGDEAEQESEPADEPSMRDIVAKRVSERRRAEENPEEPTQGGPDPQETAPAKSTPEQEEEGPEQGQAAPDLVTVKVYGKTFQVPRDDVEGAGGVEAYQKRAAASELLRRTNEDRKRLREEQRQWAAQVASNAATTKQPAGGAQNLEALTERFSAAQLEDDYAGMAQAMREMQSLSEAAQTSTAHLEAVEELLNRREKEQDRMTGTRWFYDAHPHLASDDLLRAVVSERVSTLEHQYPDVPPSVLIKHAAEEMDAWWTTKINRYRTEHSTDQRVATKRAMNTPGPASQRKPETAPKRPESTADYVARRQREYDPTRN